MTGNLFSLILVSFIFISCSSSNIKNESITVLELKNKMKLNKSLSIIDVRTVDEFNGPLGHIISAKLKPLSEIRYTVNELKMFPNEPIYVICRSGNRSSKASSILRENGINAINVEGGMNEWKRLNNE